MAVRSATVFEFCWNRQHVFFIFERAERREQVKGEEGEGEGERGRELRGAERGKKRRGPTSAAAANGGDGGGQKGARETERERERMEATWGVASFLLNVSSSSPCCLSPTLIPISILTVQGHRQHRGGHLVRAFEGGASSL